MKVLAAVALAGTFLQFSAAAQTKASPCARDVTASVEVRRFRFVRNLSGKGKR